MLLEKLEKINFTEINSIVFNILNIKEKKKFITFIILTFCCLFLEAIGITLFLPVLTYLVSPEILESNKYFIMLDSYLNFSKPIHYFYFMMFAFTSAFVLKNIILVFINYWSINFGNQVRIRLSNTFFTQYLKQNLNFFNDKDKSVLTKYTYGETNHIKDTIYYLGNIYSEILIIFTLVAFIIYLNNATVILLLIGLIILAIIFDNFTKKILRKAGAARFKSSNIFVKTLTDGFKLIRDLKLYKKENIFLSKFQQSNISWGEAQLKFATIGILPRYFFETVAIIFFLILTLISVNNNFNNNEKVLIELSLLFLITIRLLPSINKVTTSLAGMRFVAPGLRTMYLEYNSILNFKNIKKNIIQNEVTVMNESIKLRNVNFFYDKNNLIFKNLNFDIFKGDKIALIGDSGSGKSTFLDILVGFLETQEGQLIIDGKEYDNNNISRNKLFGYVHQDVVLLNDNIINNISLEIDKKYIKDEIEEIKNYCKKAQIFDFINNLPDGLFTIIGEDGVKLSGGQRQRLGIVRALYANPSILILDEATNSLDKKTENHFFQVLENLSKDLTIISINHKISNESFFKKMYFLKNNNFELKVD